MNSSPNIFSFALICSLSLVSSCKDSENVPDSYKLPPTAKPSFLPAPPVGFEWQILNNLSDEFDGNALDDRKWRDHITTWRGRPPAEFLKDNVTVKNGNLELKTSSHPNPSKEFTMGGAAVSGRYDKTFGYFEARIKASKTKMSTTFWLHSDVHDDAELGCGKSHSSELDILETIGGWPEPIWANVMRSNSHYKPTKMVDGRCRNRSEDYLSKGAKFDTGEKLSADFNTYSMWWVTPNQMHFYFNGKPTGTVNLNHEQDSLPFNSKMSLRMVVETYTWQQNIVPEGEEPYPTADELDNPDINVAYYDHVRSYELTPSDRNLLKSPGFESEKRTSDWDLSKEGALFSDQQNDSYTQAWGLKLAAGGNATQKVSVEAGAKYSLTAYVKSDGVGNLSFLSVLDQDRNVIKRTQIDSTEFKQYQLDVDTGQNSFISIKVESEGTGVLNVDNLSLIKQ